MQEKEVSGPLELGEVKAKQFREAVARWRDHVGTPAPEVEFFHNWPKHEHLDEQQLRWYLYWRTLWERGQVRKTSLSYMMIHVYELLSLEYIQDPERAVERLIQFYSEFRDIQPRLDVTVVRWIGDFYLKMGDLDNALYWYTHGTAGDVYEKLSWYRYGHLDIPLHVLLKVAAVPKTQFYQSRLPKIEQELDDMMRQVFRRFVLLEGEHPLDRFARFTEEPVLHLFSSTPIHEKHYLDGFRRYEYAGAFVHFVKNCLRYGENLLRRAEGKARLKCDAAVGKYFAEIEPLYPLPEKPAAKPKEKERVREESKPLLARELPEEKIELDFSRVRSLSQETEWLVDLMQEEGAEEELLTVAEQPTADGRRKNRPAQEQEPTVPVLPRNSRPQEAPVQTTESLLGSLFADAEAGEWDAFLDGLTAGEQALVRRMAQVQEQERRVLADWLKQQRMFLDATVMSLNERAMEAGLEPLLEEADGNIRLTEESAAAVQEWAQKEEAGA